MWLRPNTLASLGVDFNEEQAAQFESLTLRVKRKSCNELLKRRSVAWDPRPLVA